MQRPRPAVIWEISEILDATDDGVRVRLQKNGKAAWLPRAHVNFLPGRVMVPTWLAKKMKRVVAEV